MFTKRWVLNEGATQNNWVQHLRLKYYYDHSREWWGQATWFYNKFTGNVFPEDIFDVVERAGVADNIPSMYHDCSLKILEWWEQHPGMATMLLPEN